MCILVTHRGSNDGSLTFVNLTRDPDFTADFNLMCIEFPVTSSGCAVFTALCIASAARRSVAIDIQVFQGLGR